MYILTQWVASPLLTFLFFQWIFLAKHHLEMFSHIASLVLPYSLFVLQKKILLQIHCPQSQLGPWHFLAFIFAVISFSDSPTNFLPLSPLCNHQQMLLHYFTSRIKVIRHEFTQLLTPLPIVYFTYIQFFSFSPFSVEDVFFLPFKTLSLPHSWPHLQSSPLLRPNSYSLFYVFIPFLSTNFPRLSVCLFVYLTFIYLLIYLFVYTCMCIYSNNYFIHQSYSAGRWKGSNFHILMSFPPPRTHISHFFFPLW